MRALLRVTIIALFLQASWGWSTDCRFESEATVLEEAGHHLLQYWDFSNASAATSEVLPTDKSFVGYRNTVVDKIDIDPYALLMRYAPVASGDDAYNVDVAMKNGDKRIHPIRCLEALLLTQQIKRNPTMLNDPTEFFSLILNHSDGRLRVYYLTDDVGGVRNMGMLLAHVVADLRNGWTLTGNLHNHSFWMDHLSRGEMRHPQGVLAPSASDMRVFRAMAKEFGLQSASITNGFHTIFIPSGDFANYRAANSRPKR